VALAYDGLADYGVTAATGGSGPIADIQIGRILDPNPTLAISR
jgi:hypothetical protein